VSCLVAATNGIAYKHLLENFRSTRSGAAIATRSWKSLLDIGCNWGRGALRRHERVQPVGIDPSLGAVMAARRGVGSSTGSTVRRGDARFLSSNEVFDTVFSYSVIQHFSRENAIAAVREIGRSSNLAGCLWFSDADDLRPAVPVPSIPASVSANRRDSTCAITPVPGCSQIYRTPWGDDTSVDCYFGIGLQRSDVKYMTPLLKAIVLSSEACGR